jgi:hypothetical protein
MSAYWPRGLFGYLARHPSRVPVLARVGWRFRARGWWRHAPFLPLPDKDYWQFRMVTFGGREATLTPVAMVQAAQWSLRQAVRG